LFRLRPGQYQRDLDAVDQRRRRAVALQRQQPGLDRLAHGDAGLRGERGEQRGEGLVLDEFSEIHDRGSWLGPRQFPIKA
jgi:hypothetical protein